MGVERDTCEWSNRSKGNTEILGSATIGAMIGGRGCVELLAGVNPPSYQVIVTWQGLSPTVAPRRRLCPVDVSATTGFGAAVVKVVSIASLGP